MTISSDAVKASDEIQHPSMKDKLLTNGYRGNILQHNKGHV